MRFETNSAEETRAVAQEMAKRFSEGDVVCLSGDLGAGKTAFVSGFVKAFGYEGYVSSPTFALIHEYMASVPIYHFDMDRISGWDDLETTGYFDYTERGDGLTVVEWSENIHCALPDDTLFIKIEKLDENTRKITLSGGGF